MSEVKYSSFRLIQSAKHKLELIEFTTNDLRASPVVRAMEMEFLDVVQRARFKRLIIDFTDVDVVPSAIFGLLFKLAADLAKKKVKIHICCFAPHVERAFTMISQKAMIPIFSSRKAAADEKSWATKSSWWSS